MFVGIVALHCAVLTMEYHDSHKHGQRTLTNKYVMYAISLCILYQYLHLSKARDLYKY